MNAGNGLSLELGKYQKHVNIRLKEMQDQDFVKRLWNKDDSLWMKGNIKSDISALSMGWLDVVNKMLKNLPLIEEFCKGIKLDGFSHIVLLGMGGSSMTPIVFQNTFLQKGSSEQTECPKFIVLDSTEPEMVRNVENEINISKTLFIVASKSGNTAEVMAFYNYFFNQVYALKGARSGDNFIAITDEGSPLSELATRKKFRQIFINFSDIGGRYSALSYFGILPAALMGMDVKTLLERTLIMINACGAEVPASQNPGVILGAAIAELATQGHDKLTYLLPPSLSTFGLWLEQLLAESTGKNGKGILPLNGDPLMEMNIYGKDRLFFQLELSEKKDHLQSEKLKEFISQGSPVMNIKINDELDLGKEFFRWEIATATAGAILGINPFDQPNVQESKKCTDHLLKILEQDGKLPDMKPTLSENSIQYYYEPQMPENFLVSDLLFNPEGARSLMEVFLKLAKPEEYISIQAYLPEGTVINKCISEIQQNLQKSLHVAVTSEFGPRYLHSTGQYYKGGPNTGLFIQLICSTSDDIQIPGHSYSFGLLKRAQAIGDREALIENKRRVILIDLGHDLIKGLDLLKQVIEKTLPLISNKHIKKIKYLAPIPPAFLGRNEYAHGNVNGRMR